MKYRTPAVRTYSLGFMGATERGERRNHETTRLGLGIGASRPLGLLVALQDLLDLPVIGPGAEDEGVALGARLADARDTVLVEERLCPAPQNLVQVV
jgi:hypothetical protein